MKIILGLLRPRAGRVLPEGQDITNWQTPRIIRAGIGSMPEARRLFCATTVRENLLMGRPRLICMDEPTMGLSPLFVDRVLELIAEVNRKGVSVFMFEQNASLPSAPPTTDMSCRRRIVLSGSAETLLHDPAVRDACLGGDAVA